MRSEIVQLVVGWVREGTSLQASGPMQAHLPTVALSPPSVVTSGKPAGPSSLQVVDHHTHTRQVGPRAQGP